MATVSTAAGARRATALIATGALALGGALGGLVGLGDELRAAAQPVVPAQPSPGDALEPTTPATREVAPPTEPGAGDPAVTREY